MNNQRVPLFFPLFKASPFLTDGQGTPPPPFRFDVPLLDLPL